MAQHIPFSVLDPVKIVEIENKQDFFLNRCKCSSLSFMFTLFVFPAITVFVLFYTYINHRIKQKELEQKEVYAMVDDIIGKL